MWQKLREVLSEEQIVPTSELSDAFGNDGLVTVYPRTEEEIVGVIQMADQLGWTINLAGRGTKRGFGGIEARADLFLSLEQYTGIVEHSPADLTLIVRSGTTLKEIQDYLLPYGQRVALDPARPDKSSIGGIIAANDSGPKRLRYGSARDHVLGLRVVYADGKVLRSGGRTVKNVAGYDLNKLFVGSMGTLGIISTVTLKLRPLPKFESVCLLLFPGDKLAELGQLVIRLQDSHLEPVSLELFSTELSRQLIPMDGEEKHYLLAVAFEDRKPAVHYQEEWVKKNLPSFVTLEIFRQEAAQVFWQQVANLAPDLQNPDQVTLKVGSNLLEVLEIVAEAEKLGQQLDVHVLAHGGMGHGLSKIYLQGREEELCIYITKLRSLVEERKGYCIIQHAPLSLRKTVSVWGEPPVYFPLLAKIKQTFDPKGMLSPKRYVGGL